MAKRGIEIPVSVTGSAQAGSELDALKARVAALEAELSKSGGKQKDAGQAAETASAGTRKFSDETKRAGEEVFDFDRKGEKLLKGTLAQFSPDMANAADMAIDLTEGISKISPALLGVAGAGAAIGVTIMWMNSLAEATRKAAEEQERLNKAQAEAAGRGVDARTSVAESLAKAGVDPSQTADVLQRMQDLGGYGVRRDVAQKAAISEALASGVNGAPLSDADRDALLAGIATNPSFSLSGDNAKDMNAINAAIRAGSAPQRQEFARRLFDQTRAQAVGEAPTSIEVDAARGDTGASSAGVDRLARERPDLSERDRRVVTRRLQGASVGDVFGVDSPPPGLRPGTDRSVEELEQIVGSIRARFEGGTPGGASGGSPLTINLYTTHVATQVNGSRPTPSMESIEQGVGY